MLTWVLDQSDERLGNRLVLLALAEYAHDDGTKAFPSNATLMRRTRLSERAVRDCLRSLEKSRSVTCTSTLPNGTRVYTVNMARGAESAGAESAGGGAANDTDSAPDPRTNPRTPSSSSSGNGRAPLSVSAKKVSPAEHDLCDAILAAFNEATGKSFAGVEWRKKIILRIREHPELEAARHAEIIALQVEHPWWTGDPTPSVIYGNGATFDRALNKVRGGPPVDDGMDRFTKA